MDFAIHPCEPSLIFSNIFFSIYYDRYFFARDSTRSITDLEVADGNLIIFIAIKMKKPP
jgi:hypothetical protein